MGSFLTLPPAAHLLHLAACLAGVLVAFLATRAVRTIAPRLDFVSRPKGERWSTAPTPMGGGVALAVVLLPALWLLSPDLALGALAVHLLGLWDDKRNLRPLPKLAGQLVAALLVVAAPLGRLGIGQAGLGDPTAALLPVGVDALALPLTVLFYVCVANSVNLLDNMDGSAAGVSGVSAIFLYLLATGGRAPDAGLGLTTALIAGATIGYLFHNFPPARIFMGDAGSLLLGFTLAGLAIRLPAPEGDGGVAARLAMTAFVLGAPLFDTALVWVTRKNARRPFLQGGRDHSTHRLMALGLSPRRTLAVLYGVAAALGGVSLAVARGGVGTAVLCAVAGGVVFVLLGVFLGEVPVYRSAEGAPLSPRFRSAPLVYAVELLLDVAILTACWIGAYALRFEDQHLGFYLRASALPALPVVLGAKVSLLLAFGLYRGLWRTIGLRDLVAIGWAMGLGSTLVVLVTTLVFRFENFSRGVVLIDLVLAFGGVAAARAGQRLMRHALERLVDHPRKAVLLGPDGLRDLVAAGLEAQHRYELVGVVAPGPAEGVLAAAKELQAETLLVAVPLAEADALALQHAGLEVRRVRVSLE